MAGKEFDDGLSKDGQGTELQIANNMTFEDNEDTTTNKSPLSLSAGAEEEIVIPDDAAVIVINCDVDLYFSDVTGFSSKYSRIIAGADKPLPCANQDSIFIKNSDASNAVTVYFHFENI